MSGSRSAPRGSAGASTPSLVSEVRRTSSDPRGLVSGILVLARWIQNVAIGLWMGAILTLSYLAYYTNHYPAFDGRVEAGKFLGPLFIQMTEFGGICGVVYLVMLMIHDPLWRRYHHTAGGQFLSFLRTIVSAAMVGAAGYLLYRVTPQMLHYQEVAQVVNGSFVGGAGWAFNYWHKLFEHVTMGIFGAGFLLMLLTQMSRRKR